MRRKHSCPFIEEAKIVLDPKTSSNEKKAATDKIHECFVLSFDQRAFIVAANDNLEAMRTFFDFNLLLENGSFIRKCKRDGKQFECRVKDVKKLVNTAIQAGVMRRFMAPSILLGLLEHIVVIVMTKGDTWLDILK